VKEKSSEQLAVEAKLAEVEARRAARQAARATDDELEAAKMRLAESQRLDRLEEAVLEAEAKHGKIGKGIAVVHCKFADGSPLGSVIVKRPVASYYERYQHAYQDLPEAKRRERTMELVAHALVWPSMGEVEALIKELPGSALPIANAIARLAGEHREDLAGKP
jgi:hypothetical protein